MRRARRQPVVPVDPEIERTTRRLNRERREQEAIAVEMVENKTLREFSVPSVNGSESSIARLAVQANNFKIKPAIIQMIQQSVQFKGDLKEVPNLHLANFLEICDTFKSNGVLDDAIRLRLFPFSLRDKAKRWLMALSLGTITTWNELTQKFLTKFFPPAKFVKMRNDITSFL